ncbi:unnamed protein product [Cyprideis torosa]|uniref:palmitoyl-CoA hydrolase n=1 Tax=Cyprideis torosa TaxID=163714 RepID=A0A7R8ZIA8_9CRUS|nr:unnamed protein product [Cyprideis torosa]CAG0885685.1 unnamed protein product [Cyprideis torosa]
MVKRTFRFGGSLAGGLFSIPLNSDDGIRDQHGDQDAGDQDQILKPITIVIEEKMSDKEQESNPNLSGIGPISSDAYKPVVLIHGILSAKGHMNSMADLIRKLGIVGTRVMGTLWGWLELIFARQGAHDFKVLSQSPSSRTKKGGKESSVCTSSSNYAEHPGTDVYVVDAFNGYRSLLPMWFQVGYFSRYLEKLMVEHPSGIHLLGYSQGGLIARAIVESISNHTIRNFISLSSPQAGQFGDSFLHLIYPSYLKKKVFELFYSHLGQISSVANYWKDPHHLDLYLKFSHFLPYLNNEKEHQDQELYRQGILKLNKLVMIGGPDDGIIMPWQSSHFGYYDTNETVVPMENGTWYEEDRLGLRTLKESGRLELFTVPGVQHFDWHKNKAVLLEYILPFLD